MADFIRTLTDKSIKKRTLVDIRSVRYLIARFVYGLHQHPLDKRITGLFPEQPPINTNNESTIGNLQFAIIVDEFTRQYMEDLLEQTVNWLPDPGEKLAIQVLSVIGKLYPVRYEFLTKTITEDIRIEILENLIAELDDRLVDLVSLPINGWSYAELSFNNNTMIVKDYGDYRILDWTYRTRSGEWKT